MGARPEAPSQESISETFTRAYDKLAARPDVDPARIVFFGRSLGGGAVCDLAAKRPAAALILMSCFTSVRSFAIRYLAPSFLIRDPFDNLAVVRDYSGPVLVIHGRFDEIIPFGHGKALHEAARNGKMIAYDAGHNDCPPDWAVFWRDAERFKAHWNPLTRIPVGIFHQCAFRQLGLYPGRAGHPLHGALVRPLLALRPADRFPAHRDGV